MAQQNNSIIRHNMRIFYIVDCLRALFFFTSIWVAYELQFITISQLTTIEACIIGSTLILQLPTGAFADMFGKRKAMIIGCLLYVIALSMYSVSTSFSQFLVYAFLMGAAGSFIDGTREALLYDTLKEEGQETKFSFISSKLSMIFQISISVATLIGSMVGSYSFIWPIRLTAGAYLIAAILCYFYREPSIDTEVFTLKNYLNKTKAGLRELMKTPFIKKLSLFYIMIGSVTWVTVITFNMMFLTQLKFTTEEIGFTVSLGRILNGVVLFSLIGMGTFFTRRRTFLLLPIIIAVSFIPAAFMTKWWALVPVFGAMFVSSARWNLLTRYTNAEFSSQNRATAISALSMIIGLVYVIVVGASGPIIEKFHNVGVIYTFLGIMTVITTVPMSIHLAKHHG